LRFVSLLSLSPGDPPHRLGFYGVPGFAGDAVFLSLYTVYAMYMRVSHQTCRSI
jgi:hypothetical protein